MKKEVFEQAMRDIDDDLLEEVGRMRAAQGTELVADGQRAAQGTEMIADGQRAAQGTELIADGQRAAQDNAGEVVPSKAAKGRSRIRLTGGFVGTAASILLIIAGAVTAIAVTAGIRRKNKTIDPAATVERESKSTADPRAQLPEITDFSLWTNYNFYDSGERILPEQGLLNRSDYGIREEAYELTKAEEAAYHARLEAAGFTVEKMSASGALIYSDNAYIIQGGTAADNADDSEKTQIWLTYVERSPEQRGGISEDEARICITGGYRPIDVTPDGLYEETGVQAFFVPNKYTVYSAPEKADMEGISYFLYFTCGGKVITECSPFSPTMAAADVDNDGVREVMILGPNIATSSSRLCVKVFREESVAYEGYFCTPEYCYFSFFSDEKNCLKLELSDMPPIAPLDRAPRQAVLSIGVEDGQLVLSDGNRLYRFGEVVPYKEDSVNSATPAPTMCPTVTPILPTTPGPKVTEDPEETEEPYPTSHYDMILELTENISYGYALLHTDRFGRTPILDEREFRYFHENFVFTEISNIGYVNGRHFDEITGELVYDKTDIVGVTASCTMPDGEIVYDIDFYYDESTDTFYSTLYADIVKQELYDRVSDSLGLPAATIIDVNIREQNGLIDGLRDDVRTLSDMIEKNLMENCTVDVKLKYSDQSVDLESLPRETIEKALVENQLDSLSLLLIREGTDRAYATDDTGYYIRESVEAAFDKDTGNILIVPAKYGLVMDESGAAIAFQEQYVNVQIAAITDFDSLPEGLKDGDIYRAFRIDVEKIEGQDNVSGGNVVQESGNSFSGTTLVARYGVFDICLMPGPRFTDYFYKDETGGFLYEGSVYSSFESIQFRISEDDFTDGKYCIYFVFDNYYFD